MFCEHCFQLLAGNSYPFCERVQYFLERTLSTSFCDGCWLPVNQLATNSDLTQSIVKKSIKVCVKDVYCSFCVSNTCGTCVVELVLYWYCYNYQLATQESVMCSLIPLHKVNCLVDYLASDAASE